MARDPKANHPIRGKQLQLFAAAPRQKPGERVPCVRCGEKHDPHRSQPAKSLCPECE